MLSEKRSCDDQWGPAEAALRLRLKTWNVGGHPEKREGKSSAYDRIQETRKLSQMAMAVAGKSQDSRQFDNNLEEAL
jgi:hypothetical protein